MSASQVIMLACFALAGAAYALPIHLAAVRRWYDTFDALEEIRPDLAQDWYDHMPLYVRPWRRWVEGPA